MHHSQIHTPKVFCDTAPSVPSFIGSKVIFGGNLVCALQAPQFLILNLFSYFTFHIIEKNILYEENKRMNTINGIVQT